MGERERGGGGGYMYEPVFMRYIALFVLDRREKERRTSVY